MVCEEVLLERFLYVQFHGTWPSLELEQLWKNWLIKHKLKIAVTADVHMLKKLQLLL